MNMCVSNLQTGQLAGQKELGRTVENIQGELNFRKEKRRGS